MNSYTPHKVDYNRVSNNGDSLYGSTAGEASSSISPHSALKNHHHHHHHHHHQSTSLAEIGGANSHTRAHQPTTLSVTTISNNHHSQRLASQHDGGVNGEREMQSSFRLPPIKSLPFEEPTAYDVLRSHRLVDGLQSSSSSSESRWADDLRSWPGNNHHHHHHHQTRSPRLPNPPSALRLAPPYSSSYNTLPPSQDNIPPQRSSLSIPVHPAQQDVQMDWTRRQHEASTLMPPPSAYLSSTHPRYQPGQWNRPLEESQHVYPSTHDPYHRQIDDSTSSGTSSTSAAGSVPDGRRIPRRSTTIRLDMDKSPPPKNNVSSILQYSGSSDALGMLAAAAGMDSARTTQREIATASVIKAETGSSSCSSSPGHLTPAEIAKKNQVESQKLAAFCEELCSLAGRYAPSTTNPNPKSPPAYMPAHMAELSRQVILHLSVIAARTGYLELAALCTGSLLAQSVPAPVPTTGRGAKGPLPGRGRQSSGSMGAAHHRNTGSSAGPSVGPVGLTSVVSGQAVDAQVQKEAQRDMHTIRVRRDALQARAAKAAAKTVTAEKRRADAKKRKDEVEEGERHVSDRSDSEEDDASTDEDTISEVHTHRTGKDMDATESVDQTNTGKNSPAENILALKSDSPEDCVSHPNKGARVYDTNDNGNMYYANKRKTADFTARYVKRRRIIPPGKCHSCGTADTPEWRKGPDGPKTLCNSCGLQWVKMSKRSLVVKIGIGTLRQVKV